MSHEVVESLYGNNSLVHTQEDLSKYVQGGYHPVRLGDTFKDGRYKVHHRLGWGNFSTVWLARDNRDKRWVSIKIKTANSSTHNREAVILTRLNQIADENLGGNGLVQLLDHFSHHGPNGSHQCLVFELLGPTVSEVIEWRVDGNDPLESDMILNMSKQLLRAVTFLHRAGYVHGDINDNNITFSTRTLSKMTPKKLFKTLGEPKTMILKRKDGHTLSPGVPPQLVKITTWPDWCDEDEEDLRIIDLGEAFAASEQLSAHPQPRRFRAPETILGKGFGQKVDLWCVGIMIYLFVFNGATPFSSTFIGDDEMVEQMIHFVEPLPGEWQQRWKDMRKAAGRSQQLPTKDHQLSKLQQEFTNNGKANDPYLRPLYPVIRDLMRFKPEQRISASQALAQLEQT